MAVILGGSCVTLDHGFAQVLSVAVSLRFLRVPAIKILLDQ